VILRKQWGLEVNVEHQTLLIPSEIYSIDTSTFLDIWCPPEGNIFSKERMPELWTFIESLIDEGKIIASREVLNELERNANDELSDWLKKHKAMFILDKPQIDSADSIINDFYTKYKNGYKPEVSDAADPFVVATAVVHQAVVFTQEHTQPNHDPAQTNTPKIPTVCENYGIECVNIEQFISREGFSIRMAQS
jgi:hypothetical protein